MIISLEIVEIMVKIVCYAFKEASLRHSLSSVELKLPICRVNCLVAKTAKLTTNFIDLRAFLINGQSQTITTKRHNSSYNNNFHHHLNAVTTTTITTNII